MKPAAKRDSGAAWTREVTLAATRSHASTVLVGLIPAVSVAQADSLLIKLQQQLGNQWGNIAQLMQQELPEDRPHSKKQVGLPSIAQVPRVSQRCGDADAVFVLVCSVREGPERCK